MAGVELYLYSRCSSCRDADALVRQAGVNARRRDLFKDRLSADEIRSLFARIGRPAAELLSKRSRPYAELGLAGRSLDDEEIIELMAQYPALIRRPIIVKDGRSVIGFNRREIEELIAEP